MIFKLHYWFVASGANAIGILLGVFMAHYTDASQTEIGILYMMMPFIGIICKPLICSNADRQQAHQRYLMICLLITAISYFPFIIIPFVGPSFYLAHPRLCFYILVALKVIGDASFGGVISIGDSLAINYAKRVNVEFGVYRVWGTISWMFFGIIIGQVNEIWFMPKYTPAFIVLIMASLLNMLVVYLWPKEYFKMVSSHSDEPLVDEKAGNDNKSMTVDASGKIKKVNVMTKSLLPKEVVWAHAKSQLWRLVTLRCMTSSTEDKQQQQWHDQQVVVVSSKENNSNKNTMIQVDINENKKSDTVEQQQQQQHIDKKTQLKIFLLLVRRDPRIVLYLLLFVCAGFTVIPVSFFFISLSDICHTNNRCDFSQLGGLLQVSMALFETILFVYVKRILDTIGRLNLAAFAFFLTTIKFTFYGTIWVDVDPYFSLAAESVHGVIFGIYLVLMVEMGHLFANEVEFIIPELMDKQIITKDSDTEKLKLSLLATMQAIVSNANDGIGRGVGAFIYGLILDNYDYVTLWRCIAIGGAVLLTIILTINVADKFMNFQLGLDVQHKKKLALQKEQQLQLDQQQLKSTSLNLVVVAQEASMITKQNDHHIEKPST